MRLTKEEMISRQYKYDKVQEAYEFIRDKIVEDTVQDDCIRYLAEYRQLDYEVLRKTGVFYADTNDELEYLVSYDDEYMFDLGWKSKIVSYENRYVFPVLSGNGKLHAWNGYDYESPAKYMVGLLGIGEKTRLMYNIHNIDMAYREDTIIVNEGIFEPLRLESIGLPMGISLLGKKMSPWHKKFLNRFANIILIPDGDAEGQDAIPQWMEGLTSNIALVRLKQERRDFVYSDDVIVTKTVKDLDDKLRANPEKVEEFLALYDDVRKKLLTSRYVTVDF